ncbi:hypothetical protein PVAP13_9KG245400 [Panicum virgatum]|uniref:BED-type domain-containing protein n=1 Tax=Panicum virgatum TaxID=38727 RepID=A0A8T0NL59_PANVG|nr:hypothetical protein PVAP13_9KG245400 [Panicum virgatum]
MSKPEERSAAAGDARLVAAQRKTSMSAMSDPSLPSWTAMAAPTPTPMPSSSAAAAATVEDGDSHLHQHRRRPQAEHMKRSPVATPIENEDYLSSGFPTARTPVVEVIMPLRRISQRDKRTRVSTSDLARTNRAKRARYAVGSPTIRIINHKQLSTPTTQRSPRSSTPLSRRGQITVSFYYVVLPPCSRNMYPNSTIISFYYVGSRTKDTSRQLRYVYWKEFDPITENGGILHARCKHCHDYLSGKQSIGTSHLKKHLERCKSRSKVTNLVDKLRARATNTDIDLLENWVYDPDLARKALVRMIVLHELPFTVVEYDGFRKFVSTLNPLFKMVSRTTIKLDCMKSFEDAKFELRELFKNSNSKVSLTADMDFQSNSRVFMCHLSLDLK